MSQMSEWLVERAGSWLSARATRRDVLVHATVVGAALATHKLDYVLRPGTARERIVAGPMSRGCPPRSLCTADAYVEFCCTINHGINACPPGTIAGGWWKADGSVYCDGPRYYIDCSGVCTRCTTGCESGFCPDCDGAPPCDCANGDCGNRRVGCRTFRYGRCNQQVGCVGRLTCRVVSCTPAWQLEPTCTTVAATDNRTANHHSPCLDHLVTPVVGMAPTPTGAGYWLVTAEGGVTNHGDARLLGSTADRGARPAVATMAAVPTGGFALLGIGARHGYWVAGKDGAVFNFGDAASHGSLGDRRLNRDIVGMAATPTGAGYWLVASDGGIFSFGDARFYGSTGGYELNQPIAGMARTPSGEGYWLVASDGGVFNFGDAQFHGSAGGSGQGQPFAAIVSSRTGEGYWIASALGQVLAFGDAPALGGRGS